MDTLIDFLLAYGYGGMVAAAFLAGSFFPFSSEVVLTGLWAAGLQLWTLIGCATVGNTLGGLFNYGVGMLGNEEWVYRLLRVKQERLEKSKHFVDKYGAWMGLLSWLPILGGVITIAMGLMRVNVWKSTATILAGKTVRYILFGLLLQEI